MASEVLMFLFAVYRFQAFTTLTLATFPKQNFEFIYQQLEPDPLLISTGFLKYPFELKKKIQSELKKNSVSLY